MEVTELGMEMSVKPLHELNAYAPMAVTVLGMKEFWQPAINVLLAVSIMALQLPRES